MAAHREPYTPFRNNDAHGKQRMIAHLRARTGTERRRVDGGQADGRKRMAPAGALGMEEIERQGQAAASARLCKHVRDDVEAIGQLIGEPPTCHPRAIALRLFGLDPTPA